MNSMQLILKTKGNGKHWYMAICTKKCFIIPKHLVISSLEFILNTSIFCFKKKNYKQVHGCPMGSPRSLIIADLALLQLEIDVIPNFDFTIPLYIRFDDYVLLGIPWHKIKSTFKKFNSNHNRLQYTIKQPTNNSINFLDTTISVENNYTNWCKSLERYLNFMSFFPLKLKISVINNLVDRTILLSIRTFHVNN